MTSLWDCGSPITGRVFSEPVAPDPVHDGDLWFNTNTKQWHLRENGVWISVSVGGGGGAGLPPATRQGQVLVAGAGPTFPWAADDVDCGRV